MSGSDEQRILPPLRLVPGLLFNGMPCEIALEDTVVGTGSSARIRKGYLLGDDPIIVAVKVFGELLDDAKQQLLLRELHFAREVSMSHRSIVGFLGTATVGEQTAIVSFYMKNGNLMQYIKSHPECDKKKLILQVADAVEFLHVDKKLVHGDLKCDNILVSDFGNAVLADFGLSSFVEKSERLSTTMTAIRTMNTVQFAAPEILGVLGEDECSVSKKTTASDIYAFGMLILEAISEQSPWGKKNKFSVITSVSARQHPARPTLYGTFVAMSHSWWDICRSCWRFLSHERPGISELIHNLKASEYLPRRDLPFQEDIVTANYMPDGQTIVAASWQSITLYNTASGHVRHLYSLRTASEGNIDMLAVSPGGRHIACNFGNTIQVLDATSGVLVTSLQHGDQVTCIAYSRDGTRIASGASSGSTVRLWETATGAFSELKIDRYTHKISAIAFSPDGICLAAACSDGTIRLWDSTKCAPMVTLELSRWFPCGVYAIEFSPDGTHLAVACDDGMVIFRDVHAGRTAHYFFKKTRPTFCDIAFSPTGNYIASVSDRAEIEIWDVQDGCRVGAPLKSPDNMEFILSIAFSPDGKNIVSAALEGKVRVWDLFD